MRYGAYAPENFDLTFQGTVTVRRALADVAQRAGGGGARQGRRQPLHRAAGAGGRRAGAAEGRGAGARDGARRRRHQSDRSGGALCRPGAARQHGAADRAHRRWRRGPGAAAGCSTRSPPGTSATCCIGTPPPDNAAGGRIAYKTGTSYGYRDAWAVGFDGRRTIGVWVGRPDGAPVPGLDRPRGRGADPVRCVRAHRQAAGAAAGGAARARWSRRPPSCRRRCSASVPAALAGRRREPPLRIMFPPNGARLELAAEADGKPDPVALKIAGGIGPLTVLVNGLPLSAARRPAHPVLRARRSGLRAAHRDGRQRRDRQRHGAAAISASGVCAMAVASLTLGVGCAGKLTRRGSHAVDHRTYTSRRHAAQADRALREARFACRSAISASRWPGCQRSGDVNSYVHIWVYETPRTATASAHDDDPEWHVTSR